MKRPGNKHVEICCPQRNRLKSDGEKERQIPHRRQDPLRRSYPGSAGVQCIYDVSGVSPAVSSNQLLVKTQIKDAIVNM